MRVLAIGCGGAGCNIADLLQKEGIRSPENTLFRCFLIDNDINHLKSLKNVPVERKFHIPSGFISETDLLEKKDLISLVNILSEEREPIDAFLIILSLESDFGTIIAEKLAKKLKEIFEEPVFSIGVVPSIDTPDFFIKKIPSKIQNTGKAVDTLILFENMVEGRPATSFEDFKKINMKIVNLMNLFAVVGESEYKRKDHSEVVIDTSDFFNTLKKGGISAVGVARKKIPRSFLDRILSRRKKDVAGYKTSRVLELMKEAIYDNLSVRSDFGSARSVLIIIIGPPMEITMDGFFGCITTLEDLAPMAEVRWGDFPIPKSKYLSVVVMFSGIKGLSLEDFA